MVKPVKSRANLAAGERLKLTVRGAVQGVGFRPFVFRLASELGLHGWVNNSPQGVGIEVEGAHTELEAFLLRLEAEKPPRSSIQGLESSWLDAVGFGSFEIRASETDGAKTALVLPDIATCPDCLREILDPTNRRYRYPFTNCTNCGPRFSLIESLPYDRANTSMKAFSMCPACQREYDDPRDRRFHAQPNACPVCGPQLELWRSGRRQKAAPVRAEDNLPRSAARSSEALVTAAQAIRSGQIVAVKGLGGFQLLVDARNDSAVRRLRERKQREEKPLALLFPALGDVKRVCAVSPLEARLLCSPEAPIVLLRRLACPHPNPLPQEREKLPPDAGESKAAEDAQDSSESETRNSCSRSWGARVGVRTSVTQTPFEIAPAIAPGNPNLGVMLPSNPLHHLLLVELGFPVVATSGNRSNEPICTDEREALERLRGIADVFLVHNRPIVRQVDDSIARVMSGREMVLRRARGYTPLPISIAAAADVRGFDIQTPIQSEPPRGGGHKSVLAVGAHLKNSVALAIGSQVFLSQHIGDLETEPAHQAFRRVIFDFEKLYDVRPEVIAADLHPDYLSTKFAAAMGRAERPLDPDAPQRGPAKVGVQHHIAHVLSCLAENEVELPALGVAWDGTGYGTDGTIWGGEFFRVTQERVERVAHLRPFRLPGGDAAVKEPRRAALGLLHALRGDEAFHPSQHHPKAAFSDAETEVLKVMLTRGLNAPWCSSIGRLFDAMAALAGWRQRNRFEGQAAMELEFALAGANTDASYDLSLSTRRFPFTLDWSPMVEAVLADVRSGVSLGEISAKFHHALVEGIVRVAKQVDCRRVALSGGCFQNRYLTERTVTRLRAEGFQPYWHQRVPPNDGGIALGQIIAARRAVG